MDWYGRPRSGTCASLLLIGLLLLAALPAAASADDPTNPYDEYAVPFDGYRHPVSSWPNATSFEMFSFTVYAEFEAGEFQVEVATSPDVDPDGTLADANRVDAYVAPLDPRVTEEVFSVRTSLDAQWLGTLGTYYWQAHRIESGAVVYTTPVQRILITERPPPDPPSDPPLSGRSRRSRSHRDQARAPRWSRRPPSGSRAPLPGRSSAVRSGPRRAAARRSSRPAARCPRPSWRSAASPGATPAFSYKAKARLTSTTGGMHAKIDGTRTRRACARRCGSAIHWSVATTG